MNYKTSYSQTYFAILISVIIFIIIISVGVAVNVGNLLYDNLDIVLIIFTIFSFLLVYKLIVGKKHVRKYWRNRR